MDKLNNIKATLKKSEDFSSPPPQVDIVSTHEVYIIDKNGERGRKICGAQRKDAPAGYVCLRPAGANTSHPGWSQCKQHDTALTNGNNTSLWATMNRGAGLPVNLSEFLENTNHIEDKHMRMVDDDIKLLYALQAGLITRDPMTQSDLDMVVKITDRILKAKEMKRKLEKEVQLDTKTVKEFINQIFGLIVANASRNVAKSIMTEILDKVIIPFNTQNRISGNDFSYEPESEEIINRLGDKDGSGK
tara:strand:- start:943 stop:1680 length:738 start_codon:yes stop_codon:yes gene_type:complete